MKIFSDFALGIKYIFRGISYFLKNRDLWKFVIIPFLINLSILALFITFLIHYMPDITEFLRVKIGLEYHELTNPAWYAKLWIWILNFFVTSIKVILGIVILVVTGILFFTLSQIIASPFYDALSEKIEKKYSTNALIEGSIWKAIRDIPMVILTEVRKMLFLIMIPVVLLIFNFVPAVGNIIYIILASSFTSVMYAAAFVDYIQAQKMESFRARRRFAKRNFFLLAGFGLPVFVPILNLLINPFMVTGGTLIYLDRSK